MGVSPEVFVGGRRLSSLTPWGDLKITDRWPGGSWEMSWTVPVRSYSRLKQLAAKQPVFALIGATRRFAGYMTEPNWDTGEMVASGLVRQGEQVLALNADGTITSVTDTAIAQAVTRGVLNWGLFGTSVSTSPLITGDNTSAPIYVNDLANAATKIANRGWGVNARGIAYSAPDPTAPSWLIMPDSGALGITDNQDAARIVARYLSTATTYANVSVGAGFPEVGISLASLGVMAASRAASIASGILAQIQTRRGWTNGVVLASSQVVSPGGSKADIGLVRAGQMMRMLGLRDERGRSAATDVVIGETIWDVNDRTVQCNPVDMVSADLGSLVENAGGEVLSGL